MYVQDKYRTALSGVLVATLREWAGSVHRVSNTWHTSVVEEELGIRYKGQKKNINRRSELHGTSHKPSPGAVTYDIQYP